MLSLKCTQSAPRCRPAASTARTSRVRMCVVAWREELERAREVSASSTASPSAAAPAAKEKAPRKPRAAKAEKPAAAGPKRPPTAYNLWFKDRFPSFKLANPGVKLMEANALLRKEWAELEADVKAPFERDAAAKKAEVDAIKADLKAEKKANARPLSAYMLFCNRNRASFAARNPSVKATELVTIIAAAWKALAPEEQQVYKDEASAAIEAWKAKQAPAATPAKAVVAAATIEAMPEASEEQPAVESEPEAAAAESSTQPEETSSSYSSYYTSSLPSLS